MADAHASFWHKLAVRSVAHVRQLSVVDLPSGCCVSDGKEDPKLSYQAIGIPTPPPPLWGRSKKPGGADGTKSMQALEQL